MSILNRITAWLSAAFAPPPAHDHGAQRALEPEAPVHFTAITVVGKPPGNENTVPGQLYCVMTANQPKWALFKCPCGCESVVTLSLQPMHRPHWRLTRTHSGRPMLYPSVWRDQGCLSHFWVRDGRIAWCYDTGTHPELRGYS